MRLIGPFAAFCLVAGAPAAALADAPPRAKRDRGDAEKLICKRWADTGSLVARARACHTRADWDRIADSQQQGVRKTQEGLTTRPNCNAAC